MRQSRGAKAEKPNRIPRSQDDVYQSKDWPDLSVGNEEGISSGSGNKERRMMALMGKKPQLSVRQTVNMDGGKLFKHLEAHQAAKRNKF